MPVKLAKVIKFKDSAALDRQNLLARTFEEHEADLRRFLRARVVNYSDREDLIQDVFLRLSQQDDIATRLSYGPAKIRAYLMVIASNLVRDTHRRSITRRKNFHESLEEVELSDRKPSPESMAETRETLVAINTVISNMDPKCREAFTKSRIQNMSYREIADSMSVSTSMIEKYVAKALVKIRTEVRLRPSS